MAANPLSEAAWKIAAKGKLCKGAALIKALQALEAGAAAGPEAKLEALDEVEKQALLLLKAVAGDPALKDGLEAMAAAIDKARDAAQQAALDAAAIHPLLGTRLLALLRLVRRGSVMQALVGLSGKEAALLLSTRKVAPAARKLLREHLQAPGNLKFYLGECRFEEEAHTFVLHPVAAGLDKKLKAAILAQTKLRIKVRVRAAVPEDAA